MRQPAAPEGGSTAVTGQVALSSWPFHPPTAGGPPDLEHARMAYSAPAHPTPEIPTVLLRRNDARRGEAEALVRKVYAQQYGAAPRDFPALMAARWNAGGEIIATCGLRFAADGFFSSCYLDMPLHEAVAAAIGEVVAPEAILEVNALASASRLHGTAIVSDVILSAVRANVLFGCFTAVARLAEILARQGLPLRRIADARIERIAEPARWGSYYQHDPGVYIVDGRPAIDLVSSNIPISKEISDAHV